MSDLNIEDVVGKIDPATGITDAQRLALGRFMFGETAKKLEGSLMQRLYAEHWLLGYNAVTSTEADVALASAVTIWGGNALAITLPPEDVDKYAAWRKDNRPPGFAGPLLPDTFLASANTWYELSYPSGKYPTLVPLRDAGLPEIVKIKRVAIHAVHKFCAHPFPDANSEDLDEAAIAKGDDFLRNATVMVYLEDANNNIHTYVGTVSYGTGGALMWRVTNPSDYAAAMHGQGRPGQMSNLAQFAIGELAFVLNYYQHDYDTLANEVSPVAQTEWNPDVVN